jgi:peptidyl-prolyl cis-trans isomerase A (cyclophilin A)
MLPTPRVTALVVWIACYHCRVSCWAQDPRRECRAGAHTVENRFPDSDPSAPDAFTVTFTSTVSDELIVLEVIRAWSPIGADRFYQLVLDNFYNCAAFFRVVPDFVVQFGIAAEPNETSHWDTTIPDDPTLQSNLRSYVSYATAGPGTRTSQMFINLDDNAGLDEQGFSPFGRIVQGMDVVSRITNPTPGSTDGASQDDYEIGGNQWILEEYPDIDMILTTSLAVPETPINRPTDSTVQKGGHLRLIWVICCTLEAMFAYFVLRRT